MSGGSFAAPDHEYPSWLELRLKATDSGGLQDLVSVRLDPKIVNLTFASSPSGLKLAAGTQTSTTPFTRTVIVSSANAVSAPTPQTPGTSTYAYAFSSWSDGRAGSHTVTAPAAPTTYTARYYQYSPTYWYLRNANTSGPNETKISYGKVGDMPVVGDWDGDGVDTVGTFVNGYWYLRNSNTTGPYQLRIAHGKTGDTPKVGDWNDDKVATPGAFR